MPFPGVIDHWYAEFIYPDSLERRATKDTKKEPCPHNFEYVKCLLNNEYVRQWARLPRATLLL